MKDVWHTCVGNGDLETYKTDVYDDDVCVKVTFNVHVGNMDLRTYKRMPKAFCQEFTYWEDLLVDPLWFANGQNYWRMGNQEGVLYRRHMVSKGNMVINCRLTTSKLEDVPLTLSSSLITFIILTHIEWTIRIICAFAFENDSIRHVW